MAPRAASRLESLGYVDIYEYKAGKQDWLAAGLPTEGEKAGTPRAGGVARGDVPTCRAGDRLGAVAEQVRSAGWDAVVAVDGERVVVGILRARELDKDPALTVEKAMVPGPSTFRPSVPIAEMADYMTEHSLECSPITTPEGVLVGLLYRSDAARAAGTS